MRTERQDSIIYRLVRRAWHISLGGTTSVANRYFNSLTILSSFNCLCTIPSVWPIQSNALGNASHHSNNGRAEGDIVDNILPFNKMIICSNNIVAVYLVFNCCKNQQFSMWMMYLLVLASANGRRQLSCHCPLVILMVHIFRIRFQYLLTDMTTNPFSNSNAMCWREIKFQNYAV